MMHGYDDLVVSSLAETFGVVATRSGGPEGIVTLGPVALYREVLGSRG